jgi:hypothetical protein
LIIFLASGRLGNQIFQYVFLKTIQKNNEKIVIVGFDDLLKIFDLNDDILINIPKNNIWIRRITYKCIKPILCKFSILKIINSINVKHEKILNNYRRETTEYKNSFGFFKKVSFVKTGYFQSEMFFNKEITSNLQVKKDYLDKAKEFLNPIENKYNIFVHIRRGDYKDYKVYGKNTILPMNYFHNQINWFLDNRENCYFIFLSDEPDFIEKEFDYLNNKIVSENSYEVDFAIMTLCNGAILSPSSFGWWGSYLMEDRDIIFAPKYWLGFESKIEFGTNKLNCPNFAKEIKIND